MKLEPPVAQYITGNNPTHCAKKNIVKYVTNIAEAQLNNRLRENGYISLEEKPTKQALNDGIVDSCDGKILWNIDKIKQFIKNETPSESVLTSSTTPDSRASNPSSNNTPSKRPVRTEPAWVDLGTIGTYFGVGNVVIGKWLDHLGFRAKPTMQKNESGAVDMLDMAREAQKKQIDGFIGKEPTEKAFNMGLARTITVTNRKQQEIDIVQWNLDLCKAVLVKAGHPLDTEHKMALKGKGKNSDVKVNGMDKRAQELYVEWAKLYNNPADRWKIKKLFSGQPILLLNKVEELMQMPGYISNKKYMDH